MLEHDTIQIRKATPEDADAIQEIYAHYVMNTTVSLEEVPPTVTEIQTRMMQSFDRGLPYIVAMLDKQLVGYAYVFPYRMRSAYRYIVEESLYISPQHRGQGIGSILLDHLIMTCKDKGYRQMLAVIVGSENKASIATHEKLGFEVCGTIKKAGFKNGVWFDTMLMQCDLEKV